MMLCTSVAYAVVRCLSVHLGIRHVRVLYSVETSKHILKLFRRLVESILPFSIPNRVALF